MPELLTSVQRKKYQSIKNQVLAERYKRYCIATATIKRKEEAKKKKAAKLPKPPAPPKPAKPPQAPHPNTAPYTPPPEVQEAWQKEIKNWKLVKKTALQLKVGDVFRTSAKDDYFCEVVEFLPNKVLPPYIIARLKLLPEGIKPLIGAGTFLHPDRIFEVKEKEKES